MRIVLAVVMLVGAGLVVDGAAHMLLPWGPNHAYLTTITAAHPTLLDAYGACAPLGADIVFYTSCVDAQTDLEQAVLSIGAGALMLVAATGSILLLRRRARRAAGDGPVAKRLGRADRCG